MGRGNVFIDLKTEINTERRGRVRVGARVAAVRVVLANDIYYKFKFKCRLILRKWAMLRMSPE